MDESQESSSSSSGSPAPFLIKTYDMVEDPSTDSIVSWSSLNNSFVVWNALEFARELLPKYFKHNNFSSFIRQLNTYGFRKIDPDQWEFANDEFIRGQRHLLKNIHRRKPIHSHSLQPHGHSSLTEAERQELEEEIEKLKHDKNMLFLVQQRRVQQRHQMELQIQSLLERLHTLQDRHGHIMKFLAQIIQKPDFLPDLVKRAAIQVKKRRLLGSDHFHEDANEEEHRIVSFQGVPITKSDATPLLDTDLFDKIELSLISLEKFLHRVSQASGIEMHDGIAASSPSTVVLTEMRPSWSDPDVRVPSQSPRFRPSSPSSGDTNSCTDLATSVNCADSPVIPQINHMESQPKISEIDVNMEPVAPEVSSFGDRSRTAGGSAPNVSAGANDVFWQQFLTETPGSSDTQEVESQRRDLGTRRGDAEARPRGDYWWNKKNVDSVSKKLLQLASAGRT